MKGSLQTVLVLLVFLIAGCARPAHDPFRQEASGTATWDGEYSFVPPPPPWTLLRVAEDDYSFAFHLPEEGAFPSQTTFAYTEEPFGYSRDLVERSREFFRRFLWASRVQFGEPGLRQINLLGEEGLEAIVEGVEPVKKDKVLARVLFARRGERVVAFYFTQWRPAKRDFDPLPMADFDRFVSSFSFLHPSFYQRLEGMR